MLCGVVFLTLLGMILSFFFFLEFELKVHNLITSTKLKINHGSVDVSSVIGVMCPVACVFKHCHCL